MPEQKYSAAELFAATAKVCLQQHKDGDMTTDAAVKMLNAAMRKCALVAAEAVAVKRPSPLLSALTKAPAKAKAAPRKPKTK